MQYKVPQNIDMEDKIIGPFTMKQFIYLLVSGGIIYGWWSYLQKSYVDFMPAFLIIAIPVGLLGFCFTIVKVNDRPFEVFILSFFQFLTMAKQRRWQEGYKEDDVIVKDQEAQQPLANANQNKDTRSLDDLSKSLEQQAKLMSDNEPIKKASTENKPASVNVSVKDTKEATQKQVQAQNAGNSPQATDTGTKKEENQLKQSPAKKTGIMGFFNK